MAQPRATKAIKVGRLFINLLSSLAAFTHQTELATIFFPDIVRGCFELVVSPERASVNSRWQRHRESIAGGNATG